MKELKADNYPSYMEGTARRYTPKILYVEDFPAQRKLWVDALELNGFEVTTANDGAEAVEKARSWGPDLILMDLLMPKMDGVEAINVIRAEEMMRDVPIITISGWVEPRYRERALAAGADDHLVKPISLNELLAAIQRLLKV